MTLNDFINPLKKWWWLLLVASVIAAVSSYIAVSRQPPVYQSVATLMIGSAIEDPNPSASELFLEQQLARTYANIANRRPIREATMEALGLEWLPEYHVAPLPNSQLIQIAVIDTNPKRAQAVAAELANQLVLQSPSGHTREEQERQAFIESQLNGLQEQILEKQQEIEELQNQLGELSSARQIADMQEQIQALNSVLNTLQANYASLLSGTTREATNTLEIIEYPTVPKNPIGPDTLMMVALSAAVGFSAAAAGAYLLEYLDKSIKTADEAAKIIQAPLVGEIPEIPRKDGEPWNFVMEHPRSPVADAFRGLRTNLEFMNLTDERKVILVTSPVVSDGKSTIAINLASIYAQAEKKAFFIDADLRKSTLPKAMNLEDQPGLSEYLSGQSELDKTILLLDDKNLGGILSGKSPPNPAELLASKKMDDLLAHLREDHDVIVIDSPPFIVTDAAILSAKVGGILIVIQPEKTNKDAIKAMMKQLKMVNTPILGVIANRIKKRPGYYTDYYYHKKD